jgi:hypothetical protein
MLALRSNLMLCSALVARNRRLKMCDVMPSNEAQREQETAALRKDAERYRKWRAEFVSADVDSTALLSALANAWTAADVDAAIDGVPAVGAA